ncbi:MAG TPA: type II toxin-antitoxin system HicB family antitoxin [Vicinamibacteria bacterium]|nr:type II toxin-antitoxin system HicB family antitoxin [Vicinamibacteria bacterium]
MSLSAMMTQERLVLSVEFEEQADGQWIADAVDLPGVLAYGDSMTDAWKRVGELALSVIAERLERDEDLKTGHPLKRTQTVPTPFSIEIRPVV